MTTFSSAWRRRRRGMFVAAALGAALACGGGRAPDPTVTPATTPLPVAVLAGRELIVLPVGLIVSDDSLGWGEALRDRARTRTMVDSLVALSLTERAPEVQWVLPPQLRAIAARNPAVLPDPDRMPTAMLRDPKLVEITDPLQAQLRSLAAFTGARYALMPASLLYVTSPLAAGRALLTVVVVDVRTARVTFRSVATGDGADPWSCLGAALRALTPIEP